MTLLREATCHEVADAIDELCELQAALNRDELAPGGLDRMAWLRAAVRRMLASWPSKD